MGSGGPLTSMAAEHPDREKVAGGGWYQSLVVPKRIAVVGASADPAKGALLRHLNRLGFAGEVVPVNPRGGTIEGLPVVTDVRAIDGHVDLALIVVPAPRVPEAVRGCAEAGVSVAYIMSAGFGELGAIGAALEAESRDAAGAMRLVGPNTNGMISARSGLAASIMTPVADLLSPLADDGLAVISQSGAVGAFVVTSCLAAGLAVGTYFSTGNEADVGFEELLGHLVDDPSVRIVLAYVEGLRNGPAFVEAAARARTLHKPIIMLKVGVTEEGATASASHTAAMVGADVVYEGVLRQLGVRRAGNLRQLVDGARILSSVDLRVGSRLGVVTISGGLAVMATDEAVRRSMQLPAWSPATAEKLVRLLPDYVQVRNPLDTSGVMADDTDILRSVLQATALDDQTDVILLALGGSRARASVVVELLSEVVPRLSKPVAVVWVGGAGEIRQTLGQAGIACFEAIEDAIAALSLAAPPGAQPPVRTHSAAGTSTEGAVRQACELIEAVRGNGRPALDEVESKVILRAFGIPCAAEVVVAKPGDVDEATRGIGFPLVAKLRSPKLLHKSDAGGVIVGLCDVTSVEAAVDRLLRLADEHGWGGADVVLQEEVPVGVELLLGSSTDPTFGPVVTVGIGGITAEVMPDVQVRLPSLGPEDVGALVKSLRSQALLNGFRGAAPVPSEPLGDVVTRFAGMVAELAPWIAEIDVNPLVVRRDNGGLVAVDALMVLH
jgi:acetate---CoA ligase (ADP-forming)